MTGHVQPVMIVAVQALREARRRKVLAVVVVLTALFGLLYCWGAAEVFDGVEDRTTAGFQVTVLDERAIAGSTMVGLAIFGSLFLAVVLATFLSSSAVRGDAESGLLQPVLVRPIGRGHYLVGRFLASSLTSIVFVLIAYFAAVVAIGVIGDWWPAEPVRIAVNLAVAVACVSALALVGSTVMTATATGISVLMLYGAGVVGGMMGAIGESVGSDRLTTIADTLAWLLPFQGLYRDSLLQLIGSIGGPTGILVQLGPLGSSHSGGPWLLPYTAAYVLGVLVLAKVLLARRDL